MASAEDQCADEHRGDLAAVVGADGLGDEAGRAGAEEIEGREDEVEDERADRDTADQRRIAELADDGEIDHADQRRRQIGERHRHGDGEDAAMGHREGSDGKVGGHQRTPGWRRPLLSRSCAGGAAAGGDQPLRRPTLRRRMISQIGTTMTAPRRK